MLINANKKLKKENYFNQNKMRVALNK